MKKLRIGGVPEYFNLPILLALEKGKFIAEGIELEWYNVPEGTGKMVQSLADDSLDLVVALTEGMTKSIALGNPSKIIHAYVQSPLIWGIHTGAHVLANDIEELNGKTFAISRYGSGSHLMAILLAKNLGWDENNLKFEVVNNLDGARAALKTDKAQIFLWEKYTTKFLVDLGEFKRVGEYPTPWPCFVISATQAIIDREPKLIKTLIKIITEEALALTTNEQAVPLIADRYQLKTSDVEGFWPNTQWNLKPTLPEAAVRKVLDTFQSMGQIPSNTYEITHSLH